MKQQTQPLLSVSMIFKNEIRCLERCLKSLAPLREAFPCEVVMADTGSDDGSREIAEQYADLVFDFPWINDFSAARNAVLERCTGKWALVLDADEWLEGDPASLTDLLKTNKQDNLGALMERNYKTPELAAGGVYNDFSAIRLVRMSSGIRYTNAVHERWDADQLIIRQVMGLMIHHDGYVGGVAWDDAKRQRNMEALRKKLAKNPEDLQTLEQCIESGQGQPDFMDFVRRARDGVLAKAAGWENLGPSIFRHAVNVASLSNLPETEEWIEDAHRIFPNSIYTKIDIAWIEFGRNWAQENYEKCARLAESYFQALEDYDAGRYDLLETLFNSLGYAAPNNRLRMHIFLADAYRQTYRPQKCLEELEKVDGSALDMNQVDVVVRTLVQLHSKTSLDTAPLVLRLWDELSRPVPTEQQSQARQAQFIRTAAAVFPPEYQENERENEKFHRHAYTLFLPLEGRCVLGGAAAIMELEDPAALAEKLAAEELEQLPAAALERALLRGVPFPDRPLHMEQADALASRLAGCGGFPELVERAAAADGDLQQICWARGLVLTAVRSCGWTDAEKDMRFARAFAAVERAYLPLCYTPLMLSPEGVGTLPLMHRFGWYCARAFSRLEQGDAVGYVQLLREGLASCPAMQPMVEFLTEHTPQLQAAQPPEELLALAEQVRAMLSAFAPGDPAVAVLKASPAYQRVASLVEGG